MARPRKGEEKNRPIHMGLRVSEWVRDGLERIAKEKGVSMSDVVYDWVVANLRRHGIKEPRS
jgi:hypothetical protein